MIFCLSRDVPHEVKKSLVLLCVQANQQIAIRFWVLFNDHAHHNQARLCYIF